jgi:hypothetical protein
MSQNIAPDYSLTGVNATLAVEKGLAEAEWHTTPVPNADLRQLLERRNGPAIRDTALLFAILIATGYATMALWGSWWMLLPYAIHAVFYGTASESRWHECGHGTAGLRPRRHKLVIPRAHDCITVFMGGKEAYAEHQRRCPTCYYYTPGWNRNRRVPGPDRLVALKAELAKKFDADDVEFLLETEREQWAQHNTATSIDLGTDDAESEAGHARRCADWLGWKFGRIHGDQALLRDLLWGRWDGARFQIVEPGMQLGQSPDANVLRAEPVTSK